MTTGIIFVGGPGRSGTSFVADRVGRHREVATFQDVELKILGEFGGLRDMQYVLVESFSPNRAEVISRHFRKMLAAVFSGGYGQPLLRDLVSLERLEALADAFFARLQPSGYIERLDYATFNDAARALLRGGSMSPYRRGECASSSCRPPIPPRCSSTRVASPRSAPRCTESATRRARRCPAA